MIKGILQLSPGCVAAATELMNVGGKNRLLTTGSRWLEEHFFIGALFSAKYQHIVLLM
jgi:hypothetical protein